MVKSLLLPMNPSLNTNTFPQERSGPDQQARPVRDDNAR